MPEPDARWKRDATFVAVADGERKVYLHVETRTTTTQHTQGSETSDRGETRIVTSSGGLVDRVKKGEYWVRATKTTVRSDDPKAP